MKLNRIPLIYKAISIKIKQFFINIDMFWINFSYCDLANLFALGFFTWDIDLYHTPKIVYSIFSWIQFHPAVYQKRGKSEKITRYLEFKTLEKKI